MKKQTKILSSLTLSAMLCATAIPQFSVNAYSNSNILETETATFKYKVHDGIAEITDVSEKGSDVLISVPSEIEDYPVAIGSFAFCMDTPIQVDCSGVSEIKNNAFFYCNGISEISIGKDCTEIESCGFINCDNLETVNFEGSNSFIEDGSSLILESYAFTNCDKLASVSFECRDDIIIKANAFSGCTSLTDINKGNMSNDHASLYIQEGAFDGSGIINNTDSVKNVEYVAAHNARYNRGDAKKLKGNVLMINLIVDTNDSTWTEAEANDVYSVAENNSRILEQEADKYGVSLKMNNEYVHMYSNISRYEFAEDIEDFTDREDVLGGLKAKYTFLADCGSMKEATQKLKDYFGCDELAYVVNFDGSKVSYAWPKHKEREFAVVYRYHASGSKKPHTWMHEVCHLFGAIDVYEETYEHSPEIDASNEYKKTYLNQDIMYRNLPHVSWFTACNIGWTDTVLTDDYNAVIGVNTLPFNPDEE